MARTEEPAALMGTVMTEQRRDGPIREGAVDHGIDVRLEGIGKLFRPPSGSPVLALDDVNLHIKAGEFVAVLGPSGCGKSTLMSCVAGLQPVTRGRITIGGKEVSGPYTACGIVFQRDLLLEWRTCLNNILLQFELRGMNPKEHRDTALRLLDSVGIRSFANHHPRQLSGGMRQRVAICRALAHDPDLLLMDEPFGALDALTREQLNVDLAEISSYSEKTVLFITHSIPEAVFLGDRVVVMSARPGRIIGDVAVNLPRPRNPAVRDTSQFHSHVRTVRSILAEEGVVE